MTKWFNHDDGAAPRVEKLMKGWRRARAALNSLVAGSSGSMLDVRFVLSRI